MQTRFVFLLCCIATQVAAQSTSLPTPPGRLVDVGGYRMHLLCSGQGSPTVVLEAGASAFAIDWTLVQRDLGTTTRVCAYDRTGMGWSDATPGSVTRSAALELHTLLTSAGERPPFVLVGASRGGLLIRSYLLDYPDDVTGLVFVDPASEDRLYVMVGGEAMLLAALTPEQLRSTLPRQPVLVPKRKPQTGAPFDRLPADLYAIRVQLDERLIASIPDTVPAAVVATSQEREQLFLARLLASRSAGRPFADRPTVVLSRGDERNAAREEGHLAIARLSSNSRHSVVQGAGHEIHLFEPAVVIQAVNDVLVALRTKARLPQR